MTIFSLVLNLSTGVLVLCSPAVYGQVPNYRHLPIKRDEPRPPLIYGSRLWEDGPTVVGAPYSAIATMEKITTSLNGDRVIVTNGYRYFRDSEGRSRSEHIPFARLTAEGTFANGGKASVIVITDPVSGERHMLLPSEQSVSAMAYVRAAPVHAPVAAPRPTARVSMSGVELGSVAAMRDDAKNASWLGEKEIDGMRVVGSKVGRTSVHTTQGRTVPLTVTLEEWFSPDLGVVILSTQRTSAGDEASYRLRQVVRGEPNSSLFVAPADYAKREGRGIGRVTAVQARKP